MIDTFKSLFSNKYIAIVTEGKFKNYTEEGITPGSARTTLEIRIKNLNDKNK